MEDTAAEATSPAPDGALDCTLGAADRTLDVGWCRPAGAGSELSTDTRGTPAGRGMLTIPAEPAAIGAALDVPGRFEPEGEIVMIGFTEAPPFSAARALGMLLRTEGRGALL